MDVGPGGKMPPSTAGGTPTATRNGGWLRVGLAATRFGVESILDGLPRVLPRGLGQPPGFGAKSRWDFKAGDAVG